MRVSEHVSPVVAKPFYELSEEEIPGFRSFPIQAFPQATMHPMRIAHHYLKRSTQGCKLWTTSLAASFWPPMLSYQELFHISCQLIRYRCKVHNPSELYHHCFGRGQCLSTCIRTRTITEVFVSILGTWWRPSQDGLSSKRTTAYI